MADDRERKLEVLPVGINQREGRVGQLGKGHDVRDQPSAEADASRAEKSDFQHGFLRFLCQQLCGAGIVKRRGLRRQRYLKAIRIFSHLLPLEQLVDHLHGLRQNKFA